MAQTRSSAGGTTKKRTASASATKAKPTAPKRKQPAQTRTAAPPKPTRRSAEVKQQAPAAAAQTPPNNQLRSVLLFSSGILVLLFAWVKGTKAWAAMNTVLLGLFGINARFLLPAILIYTAFLVGQDKSQQASRRALWGVLLAIFCSGFVQIFFGETAWNDNFITTVRNLYAEGQALHGGGLLSGIIAWPLVALFDDIGARIVIILLIFIGLMLLTNLGVSELFHYCGKPFVWFWNGLEKIANRELIYYEDEEEAYEDDAPLADEPVKDEEDEEVTFFPQLPRRTRANKRRQDDAAKMLDENTNQLELLPEIYRNIEVDVAISDTDPTLTREETNQLSHEELPEGIFDAKMSEAEELALQEMIANAENSRPDEQANVLPWATDDEDNDEGIYEENQEIPYIAPPLTLLSHVDNTANNEEKSAELYEKSKLLRDTLASFGVEVRIVGMRRGPSVTRYEIQPAAGVKISKITALADDIGMNLGGEKVRIEAPIPGKPAVGVEVANNTKDIVPIRDILESAEFQESKSKLTFAVGKDIDGNIILGDIAKMPHMIIAGTTGSGKSVCTNSIIMSVLFHASPEEVRLVLIDPKVVEFAPYDGIPHLLIPVVTNPQKAAGALNWAVIEMERRYQQCAQYGVRDLKGYNALAERNPEIKKLPQILIIIDEFADLMMSAAKEVETAVIRIAQKARAAGIHLIIATQRPTVDVITGLIKANVPSRIGMSVKSSQDSRIILDCSGAETLLGNGDLLFYPNGWREPKRVQGCFCSDSEVEAVTSFLKNNGSSEYDAEIMEAVEQNIPTAKGEKLIDDDNGDQPTGDEELILRAAEYAVDAGQLSTTALQRRLKLGYARAARIVDSLEERGVIGPSEGAKPRRVLMSPQELTEWKLRVASKGAKFEE